MSQYLLNDEDILCLVLPNLMQSPTMLTLAGCHIQSKIYESNHSTIYRGLRRSDRRPIILKVLKPNYRTPIETARYKQEYEILKSLSLDGVIKVYSLEKYQKTWVLSLEDFGGESLKFLMKQRTFSLEEFFNLAIRITEVLGDIHAANIIHKDINPSNIIFHPATEELKIIDFGIATQLTRENLTLKNPSVLEGTLAYISPEQTGRMNRCLDFRTDFYSLGVTFYELLTHQLPFEVTDTLEFVHCHLAKQPIPPHELNSEIPQAVSEIVMKLLAKTAEERYQSAWGIKADLVDCLMQLEAHGTIETIFLGENDISDRFQIPQKLYGRETELSTLLAAVERVRGTVQGETYSPQKTTHLVEWILVSGPAGLGKSALIQELYTRLAEQAGYFIRGKFDPVQQHLPYAAIVKAFQSLMQQLLTENTEPVKQWQNRLQLALGNDAHLITEVIPEVQLILGSDPCLSTLNSSPSPDYFNSVFLRFLKVFCQNEYPLVVFLDDLQWIDAASLELIELIMQDEALNHFLLIGAYRNSEVSATHSLILTLEALQKAGKQVNQIFLSPLNLEEITQLISETLYRDQKTVKPLAETVEQKTGGNPFFVHQFLKMLYQEKLINFDFELLRWQWDLSQIQVQNVTDKLVELLVSQIQKLAPATQQVLQLAARVGQPFDAQTLAGVSDKSLQDIATFLLPAVSARLTDSSSSEALDFATIIKASQAISSEILLDKLLAYLMKIALENAGAQKGLLILAKEGRLLIEAESSVDTEEVAVMQSLSLEKSQKLPVTVINYVERTCADVVLNNAVCEGNFTTDSYIVSHQVKSILCTPILNGGKLIGILYLENKLIVGAFTSERIQVLKLLSSQAANSLENALLYANLAKAKEQLEEYSRTLEARVEERTRELTAKEEFLRSIYDGVEQGIFVVDVSEQNEFFFAGWNRTAEAIVGVNSEDALGKTPGEVFGPVASLTLQQHYKDCLEAGTVISYEECFTPQGIEIWSLTTLTPLRGRDGKINRIVGTSTPITDRKQAEIALQNSEAQLRQTLQELQRTQAQLIHTEKMSSLGQLVAGVAHEINNPVSFIYGNINYANEYVSELLNLIDLYQKYYPAPAPEIVNQFKAIEFDFIVEDLQKLFSSMKVGAERIRNIVLGLRNFSRLDEAEMKPVHLHDGIESTLMLLRSRLFTEMEMPKILVIKEYGTLPKVTCYASQINQVFMNILTNAIDALELWQQQAAVSPNPETPALFPTLRLHTAVTGPNRVTVKIANNGPGMTQEVLKRIFDPFFTTKPVGAGTGLGLSIAYQIVVNSHKGELYCFSTPSSGTEFVMTIPIGVE